MIRYVSFFVFLFFQLSGVAQVSWQNVDSLYKPLPASVKIYYTNTPIDTAPFRAYYLIADLNDKRLDFTTDTTLNRRATPASFYRKNNTGDMMARITEDVSKVRMYLGPALLYGINLSNSS